MAFEVDDTKEIARPRDEVFDVFSNMMNELKWNPSVKTIEETGGGELGVGSSYKAAYKKRGSMTFHLTEFDRPKRFAMAGKAPGVDFVFGCDLEEVPNGTRISSHAEFAARGPMKLLMPMMKPMMRKQMLESQTHLKSFLENQATGSA